MAPELSDLASHQSPSLGRETETVEQEGQTDRPSTVCLPTLHAAPQTLLSPTHLC